MFLIIIQFEFVRLPAPAFFRNRNKNINLKKPFYHVHNAKSIAIIVRRSNERL